MKSLRLLLPGMIFLLIHACSPSHNPDITSGDLSEHLEFLASDSLKGRYPGTPEDSVLMTYIRDEFREYNLRPYMGSYIHSFRFVTGTRPDTANYLEFNAVRFSQGRDFFPRNFSASAEISAGIAFAGYGFDFETDSLSRNDYSNANVEGKWAMILLGEPANEKAYIDRSREMDKVLLAADKGAAGVIFVAGKEYDPNDDLELRGESISSLQIPVIQVKRETADKILSQQNISIEELESTLISGKSTGPASVERELKARIQLEREYAKTGNVCGYIEGSGPGLKDQWIIVGAHHDHLGMGGEGSSSRQPDTVAVHYGADDNASGVATVLEVAGWFAGMKNPPARSILFCTFGAEEKGLLGSKSFVDSMGIKPENISLMINIDMIGRMKEDSVLQIGGVGTAKELRSILTEINDEYNFELELSEAGYGPSDHASFYREDIPVIFLSTGPHKDYHTPNDRVDSLNIDGMAAIDRFITEVAFQTANLDSSLTYTEAGPKENTSRSHRNRITLGIMPDVSGESKGGMEVLAVTSGKPADLGGMKKGDIIVSIEGKEIGNVYDYMYRLNSFKYGETIVVTVKRNDKLIDLLIQL